MERNQALEEYWGLRKLLNLGNKVADERSEITFKIEPLVGSEYRLLATAISKNEVQKIELARRDQRKNWDRSGFTNFKNFENYCANFLNKKEKQNQRGELLKKQFTTKEIEQFGKDIQNDIDTQLIGYNF